MEVSDLDRSILFSILSISCFRELIKKVTFLPKGNIKQSQDKDDTTGLWLPHLPFVQNSLSEKNGGCVRKMGPLAHSWTWSLLKLPSGTENGPFSHWASLLHCLIWLSQHWLDRIQENLVHRGSIYAPCPLIWVGSGTDHQNIAEVMLCQFPCTGLKRLTASASFLRILLLREATCHAGRGPELTKVGGRQGEMLASPSCSSHSNWNADMSLKKASWTSKAATENCNRR